MQALVEKVIFTVFSSGLLAKVFIVQSFNNVLKEKTVEAPKLEDDVVVDIKEC